MADVVRCGSESGGRGNKKADRRLGALKAGMLFRKGKAWGCRNDKRGGGWLQSEASHLRACARPPDSLLGV